MWLAPAFYVAVSVLLWKYAGAVFVPQLLTRTTVRLMPVLADLQTFITINASLIYFGAYLLVALFWFRLKDRLKSPFIAALVLWLINIVIVFPMLGRGVLGYRLPQGWFWASFPLLVSHWAFARGLQLQQRR